MKYLLTFVGGDATLRYQNLAAADPRKHEEHLRKWNAWMAGVAKEGKFETGYALGAERRKVAQSGVENYQYSEDSPGGFIVIAADSIDDAARIALSSPIIENGGTVLVRACGEVRRP